MDKLIDANTLTPEKRREVMPSTAKEFKDGFFYAARKELGMPWIVVQENGYRFKWEAAK